MRALAVSLLVALGAGTAAAQPDPGARVLMPPTPHFARADDAGYDLSLTLGLSGFSKRVGAGLAANSGAFHFGLDLALEALEAPGLPANRQSAWPRLSLVLGAAPLVLEVEELLQLTGFLLAQGEVAPVFDDVLVNYVTSASAGAQAELRALTYLRLGLAVAGVVDPTAAAATGGQVGVDLAAQGRVAVKLGSGWIGLSVAVQSGLTDGRGIQCLVRLTAQNGLEDPPAAR